MNTGETKAMARESNQPKRSESLTIMLPFPPDAQDQIRQTLTDMAREIAVEVRDRELQSKDFMSLKETAVYLGCSLTTLKAYIHQEDLPTIRLNGRVFVSKESLKKWMHDHEE